MIKPRPLNDREKVRLGLLDVPELNEGRPVTYRPPSYAFPLTLAFLLGWMLGFAVGLGF